MGIEESLQKMQSLLEKIDAKLDTMGARISALEIGGGSSRGSSGSEAHARSPSDIVMDQKMEEKGPVQEGRKKCPKCGSTEFLSMDDKATVLSYVAGKPIYGKIASCKKCGTTF